MENIEQGTTINIEYEVDGGNLIEKRTPTDIQVETTTYNIPEIQAEISKIDAVIAQWQALREPKQAIVDKYNEIA